MASISGRGSKGHHTYKLTLTEASQSIPNNVTTINYVFELIDDGNWWWGEWNTKIAFSITANGANITSGYIPDHWEKNQTIASGSFTVPHNTDGTKSISFGFSVTDRAYQTYTSGDASANGTMTLTVIPRYVNITSFSVTAIDETSVKFSWSVDANCDYAWCSTNNGSTWVALPNSNIVSGLSAGTSYNFKLRLRRTDSQLTTDSNTYNQTTYDYPKPTSMNHFTIGNGAEINVYNPLNRTYTLELLSRENWAVIGTYTGTHPGIVNAEFKTEWAIQEQYKSIPNQKTGGYIARVTYNGVVRSLDWGGTYTIKGTETPTINAFDYIDNNATGTVNITQNEKQIVQNKSMLLARFNAATPNYYAGSIVSYKVECNGNSVSGSQAGSYEVGTINSERDVDLILTATDSRGLSASKTIRVSMLPCSDPGAIVTLQRLNNYEDETYLTVDGSISSVNGKNTMTIQYRYKQLGGNYGSFVTIGDNVKQTLSLDKNQIFIFNVVVTDSFWGRHDKEYTLNKGVFPLFIDTEKNSVGVNKFPVYDKSLEARGLMSLGEREVLEVASGTSVEIPIFFALCSGLVNFRISGANLEIARLFYVFRTNQYFGAHKALFDESYNNTTTVVPVEIYNADVGYMFKFTNNHSSTIHIRYGIFELC